MIIAVTGWRDHADAPFIRYEMQRWIIAEPLHIRVGDAQGADEIVINWCKDNGISFHMFVARRFPSGALMPGAGPQRNREMLTGKGDPARSGYADLLLAFPRTDGKQITVPGSGTMGCAVNAYELGIEVRIPAYRRGVR